MPSPKPLKEGERHRKAFEVYYSLGEGRTYRKLANRLGVSVSSIKNWNREFGWAGRVSDRDGEAAREVAQKTKADFTADIELNLKLLRAAKAKLMKDIIGDKAKSNTGDLMRLMKMETELQNKLDSMATGRARSNVVIYIPDNGRNAGITPVFALPDNGTDPKDNLPQKESHDAEN